jgi:hypothetical protein
MLAFALNAIAFTNETRSRAIEKEGGRVPPSFSAGGM